STLNGRVVSLATLKKALPFLSSTSRMPATSLAVSAELVSSVTTEPSNSVAVIVWPTLVRNACSGASVAAATTSSGSGAGVIAHQPAQPPASTAQAASA